VAIARRPAVSLLALALALGAVVGVFGLRPVFATASPGSVRPVALPPADSAVQVAVDERLVFDAPAAPALAFEPHFVLPSPAPAAPPAFVTARVLDGRSLTLYSRPGKGALDELGSASEFGSPRTLSVIERRGSWLAVVAPELPNGQVGWVNTKDGALDLSRTRLSVSIDLSRRLLVVKRDGEVLKRITVGIGRPGSPTPTGRFAVTDKLPGTRYSSAYGCCIVALSAHQPNLPAGWTGGNRIAIHGTNDPSTIGIPSSAGCPHASDRDMQYLMRTLPLGTPVFIHP
jgi:hypothetical protein